MTYVVTEKCIACKHAACVAVCPADCFREGPNMLIIDPNLCIDCGNCVPACPEKAIFPASQVLDPRMIALNAKLSERWPLIDTQPEGTPLPNFAEAAKVTDVVERMKMLKLK